jgi:solute carrier family 35 protein E3
MSFLTSSAAPLMAFNFFSSVGIINVNKYLFQELHFEHSILLTAIHFLATFLCLCVCLYLKMFTHKPVPLKDALYMSAAFVGFVVFNNMSLQLNSMGFYQVRDTRVCVYMCV